MTGTPPRPSPSPAKAPSPRRRGPGSRADHNHPTRWELLEAAIELAEHRGLQALSVADITAAAGHAKGTFYVHFPDRAAFLVALHRWFHDRVFAQVIAETAGEPPGPERARRRLLSFLDACRALPGVRALLLDARSEPAIAVEVERRNRQAAQTLSADLRGVSAHPLETTRILVLAAADIAGRESTQRRKLPIARDSLIALVPWISHSG